MSYATLPDSASTCTLELTATTGRQFGLRITARRDLLGRRRYAYQLSGSAASVELVEARDKVPYLRVVSFNGERVGEYDILPLSGETLATLRAVQASLAVPFRFRLPGL